MSSDAIPTGHLGHLSFYEGVTGEQQVFIQSVYIGTFYLDNELNSYAFKSLEGHVTSLDTVIETSAKEYLRSQLLG